MIYKNDEAGNDITAKGKPTFKIFDHADLLFPNDVLTFDKASGFSKEQTGHHNFKYWVHETALDVHAKSTHDEENQMFCECFVLGTLDKYVDKNPRWRERDRAYWLNSDRDEIEFHEMKVEYLNKHGFIKG